MNNWSSHSLSEIRYNEMFEYREKQKYIDIIWRKSKQSWLAITPRKFTGLSLNMITKYSIRKMILIFDGCYENEIILVKMANDQLEHINIFYLK